MTGVGQRWIPTFGDEFDGSTLDASTWTISNQDGRPNGNNGVTWGWSPANVRVQDGKLLIRTTADGDGSFSSGHIWTKDKWSQQYGYFEARIQLPPANNGHQAAFWMTPQDNGHFVVGNDGRDGAEIDIVETPDSTDHYRTGLHWDGYGASHKSSGGQVTAAGIHDGYHDFGLLWTAERLDYYYDGRLVRSYTGVGVPRVPEVLRASVGILDWCDGDIRTASLPQVTSFDRINAWQMATADSLRILDDSDPGISLIGSGWQNRGGASDHRGTMSQSGTTGDAVEVSFVGTAVDVFVRKGLYGGLVDASLDGQSVLDDVDTFATAQEFQHRLFTAEDLTPRLHIIRLEATGRRNAASAGSLLMLDAVQYVPLAATEAVTIDVATAAGWSTQAEAGHASLSGGLPVVKTGSGSLVLDAANAVSSAIIVAEGSLTITHPQALGTAAIDVAPGTVLSLASSLGSTTAVQVGELGTIAGQIDLNLGRFVIPATTSASLAALRDLLVTGRQGGSWTGTVGITSSAAASSGGTRAVGYLLAADGSTQVGFAAPGDIDLGGVVNVFDLVGINAAGTYGTAASSTWSQGDFNYDGVTNVFDLVDINTAAAYGKGNYLPAPPATLSTVPEPGGIAAFAAWVGCLAAMGCQTRRALRQADLDCEAAKQPGT